MCVCVCMYIHFFPSPVNILTILSSFLSFGRDERGSERSRWGNVLVHAQ